MKTICFCTFNITVSNSLKINNSIGKTFSGPPLFVGYIFLLTGAGIFFLEGISAGGKVTTAFFMVVASFVSFTYSGVEIDTKERKIKNYYCLFGIVKTGKWKSLDLYLGVTLIPMQRIYKIYSRSNRTTSSTEKDYRIFLVSKSKRPAFAIKRCKTREQAQNSLDEFSIWLKFPVFSPKRSL